ncbi:hypothetical protein MMC16_006404 [Acarospora aff. strigata]|nr:hypothetical protein [Acarospora aff. strigata]
MDPGIAAAAYAVETAVEGVIGAAIGIAKSTVPLKATFHRIQTDKPLPRSSHSLSIIKGRAYIFGGEIRPREPVDNVMHIYTLPSSGVTEADYQDIPAKASDGGEEVPAPRVGHTASVVEDRIYIFGGRGGKDMTSSEEKGRVWVFDTKTNKWSYIDPAKGSPYPEARSYHASTSNEHPLPSPTDFTENPIGTPDEEAHGTIFIHAGCLASGRTSDTWAFDIASQTWSQYPEAPGPARGGASLTFAQNRLYRYGGFDGERELGGQIEYLDLLVATFNDQSGKGELALTPRSGKWETITFAADADAPVPGNRSVAGLQPVNTGQGRSFLLLFLGEQDPSDKGHEAAGKFWDDVWSFQLRPEGMTAASFKDATREAIGKETGEMKWARVEVVESSMSGGEQASPGPRGWFASGSDRDVDAESVVLWGGIGEKNERLGDGWILRVD